jgi:hypothetical protein
MGYWDYKRRDLRGVPSLFTTPVPSVTARHRTSPAPVDRQQYCTNCGSTGPSGGGSAAMPQKGLPFTPYPFPFQAPSLRYSPKFLYPLPYSPPVIRITTRGGAGCNFNDDFAHYIRQDYADLDPLIDDRNGERVWKVLSRGRRDANAEPWLRDVPASDRGTVRVQNPSSLYMLPDPLPPNQPGDCKPTSACFVVTEKSFDAPCTYTSTFRTISHRRTNPCRWEVAWFVWNFRPVAVGSPRDAIRIESSGTRKIEKHIDYEFYYLILKQRRPEEQVTAWQFGVRSFLETGFDWENPYMASAADTSPLNFPIGDTYTVKVTQDSGGRLKFIVNDFDLAEKAYVNPDFMGPIEPGGWFTIKNRDRLWRNGGLGAYCEDSEAEFFQFSAG